MPEQLKELMHTIFEWGGLAFITLFTVAIGALVTMYFVDKFQSNHAIKRNFPILGRSRYVLEDLGRFLRQYFFAGDREELPFNRSQRSWVYRAAKNVEPTIAFGSTRDTRKPGQVIFVNAPYPLLTKEILPFKTVTVGEFSALPWTTKAFFGISGMSYGAISKPAVQALSHGAAKAGTWLNTGEGGLSEYHLEGGCDLVFQIGTAKYSTQNADGTLCEDKLLKIAAHKQVKLFEIKLSQGAKPGRGGILPGVKVTDEIAMIRDIPTGQDSISPNRHVDIGNDDELLDMVSRIRRLTGKPCGLKLVMGDEKSIESLMSKIRERDTQEAPDFITLDSADGGTAASPQSLMDDVGLTIRESLPMLVSALIHHQLKDRVKIFVSGKLVNPSDVAWALAVGADFCCTARGYMFSLGCIQAMDCNKDSCPTGITTHNKKLQRGLVPSVKSERVSNYAKSMMESVAVIANSCGAAEPRELNASHARIVMDNGMSIPMNDFYEEVSK